MRNLNLFPVLVTISALCLGCREEPAARLGRPVDVTGANVRARIVEPGLASADREIGPALPRTAKVYRLRNGDVVEIGVWGEDMTKKVTVGPDGRISYYKATEVMAAKRTLKELQAAITTELAKDFKKEFIKDSVFISLVNSAGNFVSVTGIITHPGTYKINNETRLVDVIAQAGGIPLGTSRFGERFTEIADLSQSFVLRGDKFLDVDFEKLFGRKSAGAREIAINNVLLEPNDRVYIASAISLDNKIFVVGAVRHPSVIRYSKSITFLEALITAGDVPEAAWERKSFIVRGRMNQPRIIPINARDVRRGKVADITLQAGDVIFMPKTPLAKVAEVIGQMNVIFTGVNTAERTSKVKFFDR